MASSIFASGTFASTSNMVMPCRTLLPSNLICLFIQHRAAPNTLLDARDTEINEADQTPCPLRASRLVQREKKKKKCVSPRPKQAEVSFIAFHPLALRHLPQEGPNSWFTSGCLCSCKLFYHTGLSPHK